jgi:hypothetical protein
MSTEFTTVKATVTMTAEPIVMKEIRLALIHIHDVDEESLPTSDEELFQEWVTRVVDNAGDNEHAILGVEFGR